MFAPIIHAWERRLAEASDDRVVRPFEWGADWVPEEHRLPGLSDEAQVSQYVEHVLVEPERFYDLPPSTEFEFDGEELRFPSAVTTPHEKNNIVHARFFPARPSRLTLGRPPRAVLVLPQWNADDEGHVGLCRLLAWFGMSALRLTLPYHGRRMPSELARADYIVSSNIGRTLLVNRQAVLDARRAVAWLAARGFERIGILGTSLGSCLSMLTACHEPLIRAAALNHVSQYFADVVWEGLSTAHVRAGLEGHVTLERLRDLWMPISPQWHIDRIGRVRTLLVYALYDLSFPLRLSRQFVQEFRVRAIPHTVAVLPCGHYSTGVAPFKYIDGYHLTRFLHGNL
ncbi:MAG: alpha/beta hydrolase family protein [Vicinamibacteraceae bacterium]|nr:alpha/beta hydrolase family protein [Vicinamibacteraceae bacterium]